MYKIKYLPLLSFQQKPVDLVWTLEWENTGEILKLHYTVSGKRQLYNAFLSDTANFFLLKLFQNDHFLNETIGILIVFPFFFLEYALFNIYKFIRDRCPFQYLTPRGKCNFKINQKSITLSGSICYKYKQYPVPQSQKVSENITCIPKESSKLFG